MPRQIINGKELVEPDIEINGISLSFAQSMTVRVALQSFGMSLQENGLGTDLAGIQISQNYLRAIKQINEIIALNQP